MSHFPLFPTLTMAPTVTKYICVLHYPFKIAFPERIASVFFMRYKPKVLL